jgi:hypothetical protein
MNAYESRIMFLEEKLKISEDLNELQTKLIEQLEKKINLLEKLNGKI